MSVTAGDSLRWTNRLASVIDAFTTSLYTDTPRASRFLGAVLIAVFVSIAAMYCIFGSGPIAGAWDMAILYDGAWRILQGQVPGTDFHNPIGPLVYLLTAFGMKVASPSASSVVYGIVLTLAVTLPCAWWIARSRLPASIAFVFVLFIAMFLASPRLLGWGIHDTSYGVIYNRDGYALTALVLVGAMLTRRADLQPRDRCDGLLIGALLGLTLYCKITYFVAACPSVLLAIVIAPRNRRWVIACAAGFIAVCVLMYAIWRISLPAYLADIAAAGASQSLALRLTFLWKTLINGAASIYLLICALGLWLWATPSSGRPTASMARAGLLAAWIVANALVIESGNASQGGLDDPLLFVTAIIMLEVLRRGSAQAVATPGAKPRLAYCASVLLLLPLLVVPTLARDMGSLAFSAMWDLTRRPDYAPSRRLHSAHLRDFYVPESTNHITAYWPARDYPAKINEGIDLLRSNLRPGDTVTAIAAANPFSFALGLAPARDGPLWWDLNISFNRKHFPPAAQFLGGSTLVMVPKQTAGPGWSFETVDVLLDHYGAYLSSHFEICATSASWVLYRRKAPLAQLTR